MKLYSQHQFSYIWKITIFQFRCLIDIQKFIPSKIYANLLELIQLKTLLKLILLHQCYMQQEFIKMIVCNKVNLKPIQIYGESKTTLHSAPILAISNISKTSIAYLISSYLAATANNWICDPIDIFMCIFILVYLHVCIFLYLCFCVFCVWYPQSCWCSSSKQSNLWSDTPVHAISCPL